MDQITEKTIDIDQILKSKLGDKAKWTPRPLVSWLKHIVHQDRVNAFLWESRHKTGTEWLEACVNYLEMTINIVGKENLPPSFPTIHWAVKTVWHSEPSSAGITTAGSAISSTTY